MTLPDILEAYFTHSPDLSPGTRKRMKCDVTRWARFGGPVVVSSIDKHAVVAFRLAAREKLGAWSVESTVGAVLLLLRHAAEYVDETLRVPPAGRRLKRRRRLRHVPSVQDVAAVYSVAWMARYPVVDYCSTESWWRAFLVTAYTTGLRFSDLVLNLSWEHIGSEITIECRKTGKLQVLPLLPCAKLALNRLRRDSGRVFECPKTPELLRQQARTLSIHAGVPAVLPQGIRRTAANAYERAAPGAGAVLLGHAVKGATGFYLSVPAILAEAASKLEVPAEFGVGGLSLYA